MPSPTKVWVLLLGLAASCAGRPSDVVKPVLLLAPPDSVTAAIVEGMVSAGGGVTPLEGFPRWENQWEWRGDPENDGAVSGWAFRDDPGWRTIEVGLPWQAQGVQHTGAAWYRRTVHSPGPPSPGTCLTVRSAEDSVAVFLNGEHCGSGGGNWVDLDIPLPGLRPGPNVLAVRVVNAPHSGDPNRGGLAGLTNLSVRLSDLDLHRFGMVVLSSRLLLSAGSAAVVEQYVREGGTALFVFHDRAQVWEDTAFEPMLPTCLGLPSAGVGAVRPMPLGPLGHTLRADAGVVDVTANIELPEHPRFARPGTRENARWHLSPLAWDHRVELAGDDPSATPVLTSARYGAGFVVACAAPAVLETLPVDSIVVHAPSGQGLPTPPVGTVWSNVGLSRRHLHDQGLDFAEREQADVVVVGGPEAVALATDAISRGKTVLVLNPDELSDPAISPWDPVIRLPRGPQPLTDDMTWSLIQERGEPRIVSVTLPPDLTHQICVDQARFGPVRGIWSGSNYGKRCTDGSWVMEPAPRVQVGVWSKRSRRPPEIHLGDLATIVTGTGFRLAQPLDRPTLRRAVEHVLWAWEDGEPALATRRLGSGRVASFSVPIAARDPRELEWSDVPSSKRRFLEEDTAQLIGIAVRTLISDDLLLGPVQATEDGVRVGLTTREPRRIRVRCRFRDWQRSVLASRELEIVPARGTAPLTFPWPDSDVLARFEATSQDRYLWVEIAVLPSQGDRCLARVETGIERPGPRLNVWLTDVQGRVPGSGYATWPRMREPELPPEMGPASQYPLYAPGDTVVVSVESWMPGITDPVTVAAVDLVRGGDIPLDPLSLRRSSSPWEVTRWRTSRLAPSVYRISARGGDVETHSPLYVAPPGDLRSALWDKAKGVQVLGSLYPFHDPEEFAHENHCGHADSGLAWGPFARTRPGQPWCDFVPYPFCYLPNGVHYRTWIEGSIKELTRNIWTGETLTISASLVDGFNGVPWPAACLHPQHLTLFASWLARHGIENLTRVSPDSLAARALQDLDPQWRLFVASELALPAHRIVRDEIRAASPGSHLTDQFDLPMLPTLLRIPNIERFAEEWQDLFAVSSSDAWNIRAGRDYHAATYLVCLGKALAPRARIGHYHMEMLGGLGPERIAKSELIRRQNADLFWMMVASDEAWVPVETYAEGGGVSWLGGWQTWLDLSSRSVRGGHVAFPEDWQTLERLYALAEAVRPRRPRGFTYAAVGPRLPRAGEPQVIVGDQARLFGMLRGAGLEISGLARLDKLTPRTLPEGLVLPVTGDLSPEERAGLQLCLEGDVPVGIIDMGLSDARIASCLGLHESVFAQPTVVRLRGGNVRGPFWPDGAREDCSDITRFVRALSDRCRFEVATPAGVSCYSFDTDRGIAVVLLEERGESRVVSVRLKTTEHVGRAIELMAGDELAIRPSDRGYIIDVPLGMGGAALVEVLRD